MFDKGSGPPVVVVQPLQGRWQWMRRFLEALSRRCRVVTYTLSGDAGADRRFDATQGFDQFVRQLEDTMDRAGLPQAALCGISFGGTVAARFAALHPTRVTHLVIASAPGPGWTANPEQAGYVSRPLVTLPVFLFTAARRLRTELSASLPRRSDRWGFWLRSAFTALRYPAMPWQMAARVRLLQTLDLTDDCRRITAPTLVVTGEPALDHVVAVESTRQYLRHIHNSRYEMMDNTGHSGSLTQPERLAQIVGTFVNATNT